MLLQALQGVGAFFRAARGEYHGQGARGFAGAEELVNEPAADRVAKAATGEKLAKGVNRGLLNTKMDVKVPVCAGDEDNGPVPCAGFRAIGHGWLA